MSVSGISFAKVEEMVAAMLVSKDQDEAISALTNKLLEYSFDEIRNLEMEALNHRINLNFVDEGSFTRTHIAKKIISGLVPIKINLMWAESFDKKFNQGDLEGAIQAANLLGSKYTPIKAECYDKVIRVYLGKGELVKAGSLLLDMPDGELREVLSAEIYNIVKLGSFEKELNEGNLEDAFSIARLLDQRFAVTTLAFEKLVRIHIENKNIVKANEVLNAMVDDETKEKLKAELKESEGKCSIM